MITRLSGTLSKSFVASLLIFNKCALTRKCRNKLIGVGRNYYNLIGMLHRIIIVLKRTSFVAIIQKSLEACENRKCAQNLHLVLQTT